MPAKNGIAKATGVQALARLRSEREAFDRRERETRKGAAFELGEAVLKAADLALEPAQVAKLIGAAMRHGFDGAMALLSSSVPGDALRPPVRKAAGNGAGLPGPNDAALSDDEGAGHDA